MIPHRYRYSPFFCAPGAKSAFIFIMRCEWALRHKECIVMANSPFVFVRRQYKSLYTYNLQNHSRGMKRDRKV